MMENLPNVIQILIWNAKVGHIFYQIKKTNQNG